MTSLNILAAMDPKHRMCIISWDSYSVLSGEALLATSRCLALGGPGDTWGLCGDTLGTLWVPWLEVSTTAL